MNQKSDITWVVVLVESGVPTIVEAYWSEETAQIRAEALRKNTNPDYDEVGIFEVRIGTSSEDY